MSTVPAGLPRSCNKRMMMAHGIEVGQVRRPHHGTERIIEVLAPGESFPRNAKGLVRCRVRWGDEPWWETHFWPETLARFPLIAAHHPGHEEGAT